MGQYWKVVNVDKKEFIKPHAFGDGAKLMEFAHGNGGTMTAVAILLAFGNGCGGGDFHPENPADGEIVGRWAGDRIVFVGDYADPDAFGFKGSLYSSEELTDISPKILAVMQRAGESRKKT